MRYEMFFSFNDITENYFEALFKKTDLSRRRNNIDVSVCIDALFPQKKHITVESFSRGIITLRARNASARFAAETKKEKLLLCFKKNNIPVKKIICKT